jgi:hypothetical protein
MSAPTEPAPEVPVAQQREFWALMGYAVALGVFGAFAGLVFVGVIEGVRDARCVRTLTRTRP